MRIYFSPSCPTVQDYSIVAMMHWLGYCVVKTASEEFDLAMMWQDSTRVEPNAELLEIAKYKPVLNLHCRDISKRYVERVWHQVTGHTSLLDPSEYHGKAIKKSDDNGRGGGLIIDCPIPNEQIDPHCVYQRYIYTAQPTASSSSVKSPKSPADSLQLEYRLPYIMGSMPLVFVVSKDDPEHVPGRQIKYQQKRSIQARRSAEIFSEDELVHIDAFCRVLGLDIGELDILRCRETQNLYVLDANTTPTYFNLFNRYWRSEEKRAALAELAQAWEAQILIALQEKERAEQA